MSTAKMIQSELKKLSNKKYAIHSQRFFKTGKGEYAEGDLFLGIRVPKLRQVAKKHKDLSLDETLKLVKSKYHEERLLGLIILVNQYTNAKSQTTKNRLYKSYLSHFEFINNWDLVDVTCPKIIGPHLEERDRSVLHKWAKSKHLWTRRIAIVSTYWFIRQEDLKDCFAISERLLHDNHDLIHKAVGWMLREAGKRDLNALEQFLTKYCQSMPRTMLRYAIERLPESQRQRYLKGNVQ